ncbi:MAG: L-threonine 3-dehydrogenase [Thermoleophilia bacterium]
MESMLALVKDHRGPGLELESIAVPRAHPGEAVIRVLKTAICGTDVHIYEWDEWAQRTLSVPLVVGHEFVGRVVELGDGARGLELGELVTGEGHIVCGHCRNCRAGRRHLCAHSVSIGATAPGAFAEYLALPAVNVWPADERIPLDTLAIFDPLGNAVHAALSFDLVGEDVLITGAGPVGCLAAAVVRHAGARHIVVTDVNPTRLRIAEKMGASLAIDVRTSSLGEATAALGMEEGFDVGLEMSGNKEALRSMIASMAHGGRIGLLGFLEGETPVELETVIFGGLTLKGIYGREMFETWYKMTAMVQSGLDVTPVITHHFPVADYEEAFAIMRSGHSGKVILEWPAALASEGSTRRQPEGHS